MILVDPSTCSYNGFSFESGYRTEIKSTPLPDSGEITIKAWKHEITVHAIITPQSTFDEDADNVTGVMNDIRRLLSEQGGPLSIRSKGFDLDVNQADLDGNIVRDLKWGPTPKFLSWQSLGADQAADVVWCVTTIVPEGTTNPALFGGGITRSIMSSNSSYSIDIADTGLTTINYQGSVEIVLGRIAQENPNLSDTVDRIRGQVLRAPLIGFQRIRQHFDVSEDRRVLHFQVTDQEIPTALPDGTTKCDLDYQVQSDFKNSGFYRWTCTLSGTITVAAGQPRANAFKIFRLILKDRITLAKKVVGIPFKKPAVVPVSWTMRESIFGMDSFFSMTFVIVGVSIDIILRASGLYLTPGTNFATWRDSLANSAFNLRGSAGVQEVLSPIVVDLGINTTPSIPRLV